MRSQGPVRAAGIARGAALVTLGVLAVHQLRYAIAFGANAGHVLAAEGHGYLSGLIPPLISMAVAVMAAATVRRALAPGAGPAPSTWGRTLFFAGALLAAYSAQEMAEGVIAAGHPSGWAAVFANGGWIAAPLALAVGLLAALVARFLDHTEGAIRALSHRRPRLRPRRRAPAPGTVVLTPLASGALAFGFARRPPPLAAVS